MEHISLRRARELVIDIVDAAGEDYVYERLPIEPRVDGIFDAGECRYENNGKPSCLVGHVLFRAGVPVSDLVLLDMTGADAGQLYGPVYSPEQDSDMVFDISRDAAQMLMRVQGMQDAGATWGDCAEVARNWGAIDCE